MSHLNPYTDIFISKEKIKVPVENKYFYMYHYGYELENSIFWSGVSGDLEKMSLQLWIKLCKNAEIIFDIGANTGLYSLIAKTVNPAAKVFSFEPVNRVYEKLIQNCELNNFQDIVCKQIAVSNYDGEATIYDPLTEHIYSVTVNKDLNPPQTESYEVKVPTIKLSTFISSENIRKLDLMKIDVETHEPEVLEGMEKYLNDHRPTLLIEILNEQIANRVEEIIKDKGYLYFNIDEENPPRRVNILSRSDHLNFWICSEKIAQQLDLI